MKIKWKFEEEREEFDENGNLRPYYKDSEPWKKPYNKPNLYIQIFEIIIAVVLCAVLIILASSYEGYDWNMSGFRYIRDVVVQHLRM